jgi:uncharacterized protein YbjT (DUF2867 family)
MRIWLTIILLLAGSGQVAAGADLVLVAGATGRTGQQVVRELTAAGFKVRALVRDADRARPVLGDRVDYAVGDVRQRATIDAAMPGVRYVISTVGATRRDPANAPEFVDFEGVRNLAEAAVAAKVERLVVVSSAGVTRKDHPLNRMFNNVLIWKGQGEAAVRTSGVAYTIVRPGGLTDQPGVDTGVRLEQGDTGTGFVSRAGVARVCVAALRSAAARNRTFEVYGAKTPGEPDWDALFRTLTADEPQS